MNSYVESGTLSNTCPSCSSTARADSRPYTSSNDDWPFGGLSVVVCRECGTGRASPMPLDETLNRYYGSSRYESVEGSSLSFGTRPWDLGPARAAAQVQMVQRWSPRGPGEWLDVGAGYGFLLDSARTAGWSTAGIEPGPARRQQISERGHAVYSSLAELDRKWDVISLSHCLEHVIDPVNYLAEIASHLAPDGLILCEVPNDGPGGSSGRRTDEPHVIFFSQMGLSRCASKANLLTLESKTIGPKRKRHRFNPRDICIRAASPILPATAVPMLHWTFVEGVNRIWIRAIFKQS